MRTVPTPDRSGPAAVHTAHRNAGSLNPLTFKMNEFLQRYSTTHTNTLTHLHTRQVGPGIASASGRQACVSYYISPVALYWTPVLFDGSPTAWDGLPPPPTSPTPTPLCHFTQSLVLIPHPQGPFLMYVGPVRHSCLRMAAQALPRPTFTAPDGPPVLRTSFLLQADVLLMFFSF